MKNNPIRLRLESLEERAVMNVGPIDILSISADHATWQVSDEIDSATLPVVADGSLDRWTPEIYGDFNGDNVDDVLGRVDDGDWWLQANDGTQLLTVRWGTSLGDDVELIATADFDDDGFLDLISIDRVTGDLYVSENSRNGLFHRIAGTFPTGDLPHLFVDDFTGDGRIDVLAGDTNETWWIGENVSGVNLSVKEWGRFPDFNWLNVMNGDFNGDSKADVAARAPDNTWWVWFGSDDGMQQAQYWGHWRMRSDWHDVAVADFNNDGRDDLIGRTDDGRLWVGTATDTRFHTWTWSNGWVARADWSNIAHVDINDDGLMDQVGKAASDNWHYALNTGNQKFENYFWQTATPTEFTVLSNNFRREVVDLAPALPTSGTDIRDAEVTVTINEDNKIVLSGTEIAMIGLEITSASGSLIPVEGDSPAPFELLLANTSTGFSVGNFGPPFVLNGDLVMELGWDPDSTAMDLELTYAVDANPRTGVVFEPAGRIPQPTENTQEEFNRIYFASLPSSRTSFPDA